MSLIAAATKAGTGDEAGALRGDIGVREMQRQLAQLPTTILSSAGDGPHTLAEIGVRTNRDGTLGLDSGRLACGARLAIRTASRPCSIPASAAPARSSRSRALVGKVTPGTYTLTDVVPAAPPARRLRQGQRRRDDRRRHQSGRAGRARPRSA